MINVDYMFSINASKRLDYSKQEELYKRLKALVKEFDVTIVLNNDYQVYKNRKVGKNND